MTGCQAIQAAIVKSVADRGYLDGWNDDQLAARQMVKLTEELAEALQTTSGGGQIMDLFRYQVMLIGRMARNVFDTPAVFADVTVNLHELVPEVHDLAVVVSVLAHAAGIPDVMSDALGKARADAARGKRV